MLQKESISHLPKGVSDLFQLFKSLLVSLGLPVPLLGVHCPPTVLVREVNQVHLQGKEFNPKVRKMCNQIVSENRYRACVHLLNALLPAGILCLLCLEMASLKLEFNKNRMTLDKARGRLTDLVHGLTECRHWIWTLAIFDDEKWTLLVQIVTETVESEKLTDLAPGST